MLTRRSLTSERETINQAAVAWLERSGLTRMRFGQYSFFVCVILVAVVFPLAVWAGSTPIPCSVGNRWEYDVVKLTRASLLFDGRTLSAFSDTSYGSAVYEIVSADEKANPVVYNYRESVRTWSTSGGEPNLEISELKITSKHDNVHVLASYAESSGEDEPDRQTYDPPLLYYSASDAVALRSWTVGVMREREASCDLAARGAGRETVTVPAGTFKDCLRVVYSGENVAGVMRLWQKAFTITGGRSFSVYWVAEGVGVIKELEVATTVAETDGPGGKKIVLEAASCTVSELKPGYRVGK
ncbi:MAG: hypothetical protein ACUVRS_07970 [Armatimonadota bacterium]